MRHYYVQFLLLQVVFPLALLISIGLRPFGMSMVYMVLFLLSPLPLCRNTQPGSSNKLLVLSLILSFLLLLVHAAWHALLTIFKSYGWDTDDPVTLEIAHNLGLIPYKHVSVLNAIFYLSPELIMSLSTLIIFLAHRKLEVKPEDIKNRKYQSLPFLISVGQYFSLFLIMWSGILTPSVTNGVYFVVFLLVSTWWAIGQSLGKKFAVVGRCLMAIMAVHAIILMVYQVTFVMNLLPPDVNFARYFGLLKIANIDPSTPDVPWYEGPHIEDWTKLASLLVILFTYYVLALETSELFKPKAKRKSALDGGEGGLKENGSLRTVSFRNARDKWASAARKVNMSQVAIPYISSKVLRGSPVETTPLIRKSSRLRSQRWTSKSNNRVLMQQDSSGSIVMDAESEHTAKPTLTNEIVAAIIDFFQIVIRSSYIATTITMMAWSILYHSWLTFVFLMWANIVWLCHDQRSFMLKTSPILVFYATVLLIIQYVYGMDLTVEELPSDSLLKGINFRQIGISRPDGPPFVPLLVKSLFTVMFWITLRQRMQEIKERRQEAVITDLAAPLKVTVSTAASVLEDRHHEEGKSRLFHTLGVFLRALCARYWIYVVAIMLFVIGITGERMTIFRIIYMFLFLAFILMFQISWYMWRRLMYMFWIVVIIYSMINLILIYVYQFDNFSKIIEQFLYIDEVLQHDLGLEPYHPADLFVKLLTPTCFLIITIMQVHYFHKDFMKLSDPYNRNTSKDLGSSRPSQGASTIKDDIPPLPLEEEGRESATERHPDDDNEQPRSRTSSFKQQSRYSRTSTRPSISFVGWLRLRLLVWKSYVDDSIDLIAMYLEIHLIKIIFVGLMLMCTLNVCAMHVPIMLLICPALWLGRRHQRVCVLIISTLISVYLMSKMVYQIDYIRHEFFECNCTTVDDENVTIHTYNNAEWVGFNKILHFKSLASYLKGYIGLMAIFTFFSLILYRQEGYRERHNIPDSDEKLLFPNIRREDADKDLLHCIKYLLNYGFYKFGVETTLICMMGVIGSRMDLYAIIYAGWLIILIILDRSQQARLWRFFTGFLTVIIPFQYCLAVGILPYFCVQYPWSGDDTQMKHVRSFVFLPHAEDSPHAAKLIFDYFLLLFATLQLRVFAIERQHGKSYAGGSNTENIGKHWETPNFVNPIPDFTVFCGNWLDVVKRMIFLGMLWVTLAIMFMTGTNRVNLFSMGYLVGSFIFLWQGTDFYLLPKSAILLWWSWLLRYNVSVVVIKTLLQIPGCIFGTTMQTHACWLVQLLGIGCVDKFAGGSISRFIRMDYIKGDQCSVPQEDIGLAWDGVCFAFLILQKRLFHSYYFYRVIDESKATTVLASRGAELIEQLRQRQMQLQRDQEVEILEKIKVKMEKIKANQKRIQGISKEPESHEIEGDEDTQEGESEQVPLVRGDSDASGRGYHTPDSPASPRGFHTPISEPSAPPSPSHTPPSPSHTTPTTSDLIAPLPALPARLSSQGGPPSPSSALLTSLSLDAYLEPRRISFGSPPSSDLVPRAQSPEESYPVFSPPPIRRRHTVASPSVLQRTSIISQSSRSEPKSHQDSRRWECPPYRSPKSHQQAIRSGDYYMFDDMFEQSEEPLKSPEGKEEDSDAPIGMGLGKLVSTIVKTDLSNALLLRRASMPSVRRSSMHLSMASQTRSVLETRASSFRGMSVAGGPSGSGPSGGGPSGGRQEEQYSSLMDEEPPEQETWFDKVLKLWETVSAFISSLLISVTRQLMKYSRDYRYVSQTLTIEKKILKEREGFGIGIREGAQMRWEPLPETLEPHRKLSDISVPEIRLIAPSMERGLDASPAPSRRASPPHSPSTPEGDNTSEHESAFSLQSTESKDVSLLEEQDDSMFKRERAPIVLLIYALWYAILAHTDVVCYIMVFINQIQSATILSIPLPLMVFLWGTLTIPRPTKIFWVTMIAYTEVIVLIKSMFQFEILPWNQKAIPAGMPFTAPRIIGIERKSDYALYDLLLLLIIFLHRFMLKSLGLWKESKPEVELREDTVFSLKPEDTSKLVDGKSEEVGKKYLEKHDKAGPHRGEAPEEPRSPEVPDTAPSPPNGLEPQEAGPSKPPEDDHYNVNDDQEPIIAVTTAMENPYNHCPRIMWMSIKRYLRPPQRFFQRMLEPTARVTADIYAYMFLCDFINFLVIIFGFAAFGTQQGDGGVQAYLEENKVPIPFLVMLILQFALIVIDRALYLRKFMLGKILFQYALIIGVHVWMFFILPFITERTFNALLPPPMWYMVKCVYLLLSAYQIRCGYPRRIIGNFLCKSYRFVNMISFRGFMAVPFVFELRTLMDWVWTDTSMNLMDWLKMEDIFANVYLLKCSRYLDSEYPQARGAKKSNVSKYMLGGGVLVFVIAIIWFPLVFFAFGNTVGQPNPPSDVTVKIRIGPFLPVYQMSAQSNNIYSFTEQDYTHLSNMYARDRTAQTFLSNYMYNDVAVVTLNPNSTMMWAISPPEQDRLEHEAASNATLKVKFTFVITHPSNTVQNPPTIEDSREVSLPAYKADGTRNPERDILYNMLLNKSDADTWLTVPTLFPKFLKVFNKGTAKPAYQLTPSEDEDPETPSEKRLYRNVQMRLERDRGTMYWRVREMCTKKDPLVAIPMNNCDMLMMYTFNDKLFPETLNFISGGGIIGLYTTFVFLASRVIRGFFTGIYTKIMFDDLPNVDRVLQLCLDIYLVREALELTLEEDLFAKLVFLYRSPETMIKWTRPKDEDLREEEHRALPPSR